MYNQRVHIHLALYGSQADYKYRDQKGFCDRGIQNALAILGKRVTR